MTKTKGLKRVLAATALAALSAGQAAAQDVTFRLAHWLPPTHPVQTMGMTEWMDAIKAASDGRIDFQVFPAQQLGAAPDHYDMTRDGIADIGYVNPGYQAGRFPIYSLVEIPFHMDNAPRGAKAMHEWYAPIAEEEMSDVKFCLANPHDPGTIHSKTEVKLPADIQGKSVRPAHATMARFVSMLGGAPVQVPAPEAREAIANGTADAITFPWGSIYIFGIDSETKHHLDMPFYISAQLMLLNKAKYDGLPDDLKKVIDDHCTPEWSQKFSEGWAAEEASGRDKMIESGEHTLYAPTEEEVQAWRDAAAPLLEQWTSDVGEGADGYYQGYVDALEANDAKF
ncbi:C4-dicarboxylate ABC transporter [Pseudooceanicola nanhaiensis]|jgi:TRAP-type C4-dicarboxylate transport system substrate-binding protein|uniref:C4-dicarboxylate ABC transporter n=1 Tax=Pseudooceanicola nanhaiensis TaxID=375761 RepID=A0A917WND8_9RHOB|nr:TRAP transporter substrate-binding protein [Pseudooceanicola nanhaiensis]GGM17137.1 C4-dicarboxylate ABC transporter [Pseudooceanicola nanhaiensis]